MTGILVAPGTPRQLVHLVKLARGGHVHNLEWSEVLERKIKKNTKDEGQGFSYALRYVGMNTHTRDMRSYTSRLAHHMENMDRDAYPSYIRRTK